MKLITEFFLRILDEMGHEMENTDTKIDSTLKKMAKVLRMSNGTNEVYSRIAIWVSSFMICLPDRRQWMAIGVLTGLMVIVIILFYVL